jgi:hypothetical protein
VTLEAASRHSKMQFSGRSDAADLSSSARRQRLSPGLEIRSVLVARHRWRRSQLHRPKSDREDSFSAGPGKEHVMPKVLLIEDDRETAQSARNSPTVDLMWTGRRRA